MWHAAFYHRVTVLAAPFLNKFDDAPTDVISLCDSLQHATTVYEESKKLTC